MIQAGKLRRRLVIWVQTTPRDDAGQDSVEWVEFATVRADIRAPSGVSSAERIVADQEVSTATYSARIRYRTDITSSMRASENGEVFSIAQVIPDRAGRKYTDIVLVAGAVPMTEAELNDGV